MGRDRRQLLLRHFLCSFGLRGLLSQPCAVGFARDLQNDRPLDQPIQECHRQRTVGRIFSPLFEVHVGHYRGRTLLIAGAIIL